jgi:hypothetical protein
MLGKLTSKVLFQGNRFLAREIVVHDLLAYKIVSNVGTCD